METYKLAITRIAVEKHASCREKIFDLILRSVVSPLCVAAGAQRQPSVQSHRQPVVCLMRMHGLALLPSPAASDP
jgi:hypothetical protein